MFSSRFCAYVIVAFLATAELTAGIPVASYEQLARRNVADADASLSGPSGLGAGANIDGDGISASANGLGIDGGVSANFGQLGGGLKRHEGAGSIEGDGSVSIFADPTIDPFPTFAESSVPLEDGGDVEAGASFGLEGVLGGGAKRQEATGSVGGGADGSASFPTFTFPHDRFPHPTHYSFSNLPSGYPVPPFHPIPTFSEGVDASASVGTGGDDASVGAGDNEDVKRQEASGSAGGGAEASASFPTSTFSETSRLPFPTFPHYSFSTPSFTLPTMDPFTTVSEGGDASATASAGTGGDDGADAGADGGMKRQADESDSADASVTASVAEPTYIDPFPTFSTRTRSHHRETPTFSFAPDPIIDPYPTFSDIQPTATVSFAADK